MNDVMHRFAALIAMLAATSAMAGTDALTTFVRDVSTLTADFTQEVYTADGELTETARGRVAIARPGRLRWAFDEPEQLIVADGESLWVYDIELDQITVSDQAAEVSGSPAALLGGDESALDYFEVLDDSLSDGIRWIRLKPLEDDADFERLSVGFVNGEIARMQLEDGLGQTTLIRFENLDVDTPIDPALFRFSPPANADVIDRRISSPTAF